MTLGKPKETGAIMHRHGHFSDRTHSHSRRRRDFLRTLLGAGLGGASLIEVSFLRAAWARAQSAGAPADLFDVQKVSEGVYCAVARPAVFTNCNAAIFENVSDILVVDAHSKPSAASALIAQIRSQISPKPVRFLVNTHFHWDHSQGNAAYREAFPEVEIIGSEATKKLMSENGEARLRAQLENIPKLIEDAQAKKAQAKSDKERSYYDEEVRALQAYREEMARFSLELPTIVTDDSYVIGDRAHDLHVRFHGRGHTAGDVVVHCPQKKVVATGDLIHGFFPFIGDGYPLEWPRTIDEVAKLEFEQIVPGHGPVQADRQRMGNMRNYLVELSDRVQKGKAEGKELSELQKAITVSSLETLGADGYGDYLGDNVLKYRRTLGSVELQPWVDGNVEQIYRNLERS